ncbi:MAG TPA: hypothetical protein VER58_10865 [Thermoanaerobaculia bacterium]|nr:hypothetical protein [Thermoanaerobaculia bacterium]
MPTDPNVLIGPIERGWPLNGVAADWILDLETGSFGALQLRMGYGEVSRLFSHDEGRSGMAPRGPAAVRLRLDFDASEQIPEDDGAEIEFATEIELDWSELSQAAPATAPLIRLPGREPTHCTSLTLADLEEAFGKPAQAEIFDEAEDEWLLEWRRNGFCVTAHTGHGFLQSAGISALGLTDVQALHLVT